MLRAITTRLRVPRRFDETVFVLDSHAAGRIITHGLLACPEAGTQHGPIQATATRHCSHSQLPTYAGARLTDTPGLD